MDYSCELIKSINKFLCKYIKNSFTKKPWIIDIVFEDIKINYTNLLKNFNCSEKVICYYLIEIKRGDH